MLSRRGRSFPDVINSLEELGVIVHGVEVKPGIVTGFGLVKSKPIIMFPGQMGIYFSGLSLFVTPLICFYNCLKKECLLLKVKAKMNLDLRHMKNFTTDFCLFD